MMARNYIVLDTEGVDTVPHYDGQAHPESSLFYDLGFSVIDGNTGEELAAYSFVNADVFYRRELMDSAYYSEKRDIYEEGIRMGEWDIATTRDIMRALHDACECYDVREVWAFNVRYDMTITAHTVEVMSNGFVTEFLPSGVSWRDVWDYAGSTLCNTRKYVKWCLTRDYVSEKGNPMTRAEVVYQYLIDDDDFIEAHTALSDARIEADILKACKRRKQRARHSIGQGWRDASKIAKTL